MEKFLAEFVIAILLGIQIYCIVICRKGLLRDKTFYSKIIWFLSLMVIGTIYRLFIPRISFHIMDKYLDTKAKEVIGYILYISIIEYLIYVVAFSILLSSLHQKLKRGT